MIQAGNNYQFYGQFCNKQSPLPFQVKPTNILQHTSPQIQQQFTSKPCLQVSSLFPQQQISRSLSQPLIQPINTQNTVQQQVNFCRVNRQQNSFSINSSQQQSTISNQIKSVSPNQPVRVATANNIQNFSNPQSLQASQCSIFSRLPNAATKQSQILMNNHTPSQSFQTHQFVPSLNNSQTVSIQNPQLMVKRCFSAENTAARSSCHSAHINPSSSQLGNSTLPVPQQAIFQQQNLQPSFKMIQPNLPQPLVSHSAYLPPFGANHSQNQPHLQSNKPTFTGQLINPSIVTVQHQNNQQNVQKGIHSSISSRKNIPLNASFTSTPQKAILSATLQFAQEKDKRQFTTVENKQPSIQFQSVPITIQPSKIDHNCSISSFKSELMTSHFNSNQMKNSQSTFQKYSHEFNPQKLEGTIGNKTSSSNFIQQVILFNQQGQNQKKISNISCSPQASCTNKTDQMSFISQYCSKNTQEKLTEQNKSLYAQLQLSPLLLKGSEKEVMKQDQYQSQDSRVSQKKLNQIINQSQCTQNLLPPNDKLTEVKEKKAKQIEHQEMDFQKRIEKECQIITEQIQKQSDKKPQSSSLMSSNSLFPTIDTRISSLTQIQPDLFQERICIKNQQEQLKTFPQENEDFASEQEIFKNENNIPLQYIKPDREQRQTRCEVLPMNENPNNIKKEKSKQQEMLENKKSIQSNVFNQIENGAQNKVTLEFAVQQPYVNQMHYNKTQQQVQIPSQMPMQGNYTNPNVFTSQITQLNFTNPNNVFKIKEEETKKYIIQNSSKSDEDKQAAEIPSEEIEQFSNKTTHGEELLSQEEEKEISQIREKTEECETVNDEDDNQIQSSRLKEEVAKYDIAVNQRYDVTQINSLGGGQNIIQNYSCNQISQDRNQGIQVVQQQSHSIPLNLKEQESQIQQNYIHVQEKMKPPIYSQPNKELQQQRVCQEQQSSMEQQQIHEVQQTQYIENIIQTKEQQQWEIAQQFKSNRHQSPFSEKQDIIESEECPNQQETNVRNRIEELNIEILEKEAEHIEQNMNPELYLSPKDYTGISMQVKEKKLRQLHESIQMNVKKTVPTLSELEIKTISNTIYENVFGLLREKYNIEVSSSSKFMEGSSELLSLSVLSIPANPRTGFFSTSTHDKRNNAKMTCSQFIESPQVQRNQIKDCGESLKQEREFHKDNEEENPQTKKQLTEYGVNDQKITLDTSSSPKGFKKELSLFSEKINNEAQLHLIMNNLQKLQHNLSPIREIENTFEAVAQTTSISAMNTNTVNQVPPLLNKIPKSCKDNLSPSQQEGLGSINFTEIISSNQQNQRNQDQEEGDDDLESVLQNTRTRQSSFQHQSEAIKISKDHCEKYITEDKGCQATLTNLSFIKSKGNSFHSQASHDYQSRGFSQNKFTPNSTKTSFSLTRKNSFNSNSYNYKLQEKVKQPQPLIQNAFKQVLGTSQLVPYSIEKPKENFTQQYLKKCQGQKKRIESENQLERIKQTLISNKKSPLHILTERSVSQNQRTQNSSHQIFTSGSAKKK